MKLFMCFGGAAAAAAVIDDEAAEAVATARHRGGQRRGRRSLSFRGKFLFGNNKGGSGEKKAESKERVMDYTDDVYDGASRASSVASSALLSSAASASSLDFDTSPSSRSSTASSSPSVSGVLYPPPPVKQRQASNNRRPTSSPAAGAAAVVLCLLTVVFCGRVGATLLMSTALYLFPRRWAPGPTTTRKEKKGAVVDRLAGVRRRVGYRGGGDGDGEEDGGYGAIVLW